MTENTQEKSGRPALAETSEIFTSIIIAAHNEENYLSACLQALAEQSLEARNTQIIVAANACTDKTIEIAHSFKSKFREKGWDLDILDLPEAGKLNAFNQADLVATGQVRLYLDADVICDPQLLSQIVQALNVSKPRYATGTLNVMRAQTWVTRRYAELWKRLPFVQGGAVGAGCFAVNASGRARWGEFPDIISDDTFVRLHFAPDERIEVPAQYNWPMVEGFRNLVRVRRRQDAGVAEVARLYPELLRNDQKQTLSVRDLAVLFFTAPVGFIVYLLVHIAVRLKPAGTDWTRGR